MPKPRLRLRTMVVVVAVVALAFAGVRWWEDRSALLRRAERCEKFASILRLLPRRSDTKVVDIKFDERVIVFSTDTASSRAGLARADAERKLAGLAADYERLARVFRRAARLPWASSPEPGPIPPFFHSASRPPTLRAGIPAMRAKQDRTPTSKDLPEAK